MLREGYLELFQYSGSRHGAIGFGKRTGGARGEPDFLLIKCGCGESKASGRSDSGHFSALWRGRFGGRSSSCPNAPPWMKIKMTELHASRAQSGFRLSLCTLSSLIHPIRIRARDCGSHLSIDVVAGLRLATPTIRGDDSGASMRAAQQNRAGALTTTNHTQ